MTFAYNLQYFTLKSQLKANSTRHCTIPLIEQWIFLSFNCLLFKSKETNRWSSYQNWVVSNSSWVVCLIHHEILVLCDLQNAGFEFKPNFVLLKHWKSLTKYDWVHLHIIKCLLHSKTINSSNDIVSMWTKKWQAQLLFDQQKKKNTHIHRHSITKNVGAKGYNCVWMSLHVAKRSAPYQRSLNVVALFWNCKWIFAKQGEMAFCIVVKHIGFGFILDFF